jgi:hypothetical protein
MTPIGMYKKYIRTQCAKETKHNTHFLQNDTQNHHYVEKDKEHHRYVQKKIKWQSPGGRNDSVVLAYIPNVLLLSFCSHTSSVLAGDSFSILVGRHMLRSVKLASHIGILPAISIIFRDFYVLPLKMRFNTGKVRLERVNVSPYVTLAHHYK